MKRRYLLSLLVGVFLGSGIAAAETKIVCVGDSITAGVGVGDRTKFSWPSQLATLLGPQYSVINYGVSGRTMLRKGDKPYMELKKYQKAQEENPDVVFIKLGTNDAKKQNWNAQEYAKDYQSMIDAFKALPSKPEIYLCLPTAVIKESFHIQRKNVQESHGIIRRLAEKNGIKVVDTYSPLIDRADCFVPDGIHPNKYGASAIAAAVYSAYTGDKMTAEKCLEKAGGSAEK